MIKKIFKLIIFFLLGILILSFVIHKIPLPRTQKIQIVKEPVLSIEEEFLNYLSLDQKIGQMFLIGFEGKEVAPGMEDFIKKTNPGGILLLSRNIENAKQLETLIKDLQEISLKGTKLPLFVAVDQEGGVISRINFLKEKTPQSQIQDTELAYSIGFNRGIELNSLGVNLNLAPVLDMTWPDDFLYNRSFQKTAGETGKIAAALVSGQKDAGIFTAVKHFPGYGGIPFDPERDKLPILNEIPEISQFREVLMARPEMVMAANVIYGKIDKNLPLALSFEGIQFLKEKLGNDFLIISDDLSSPVLKKELSLGNTIILAFKSGVDIFIVAGFDEPEDPISAFNFLLEAVKKGEISEKEINQRVLKIINLKKKLLK